MSFYKAVAPDLTSKDSLEADARQILVCPSLSTKKTLTNQYLIQSIIMARKATQNDVDFTVKCIEEIMAEPSNNRNSNNNNNSNNNSNFKESDEWAGFDE